MFDALEIIVYTLGSGLVFALFWFFLVHWALMKKFKRALPRRIFWPAFFVGDFLIGIIWGASRQANGGEIVSIVIFPLLCALAFVGPTYFFWAKPMANSANPQNAVVDQKSGVDA
jgi:hypothetical protein